MNALAQELLVIAIVAAATMYAALKFMPAAWRRSFAKSVASLVSRTGFSEADARRVEAKLSTGGACGSCDACKACATPKTEGDGATLVAASPSHHRAIPIRNLR